MTVWDADNLNAPHTLRELAQDGEPAPGSTTEPENATCPSAGGFVAANDHSADERIGRLMNENLFLQAQLDAYREMAEARKPVDLKGMMLEAKAGRERRAKERKANLSEALSAIASEKAEWPHAGVMHAAARTACDNIAARVKKLMGVA